MRLQVSILIRPRHFLQKVERARKKAEGTPDFAEALEVAQKMRKEKERGEDLQAKIQQQRRLMQSAEQRLQRTKLVVWSLKIASDGKEQQLCGSRLYLLQLYFPNKSDFCVRHPYRCLCVFKCQQILQNLRSTDTHGNNLTCESIQAVPL